MDHDGPSDEEVSSHNNRRDGDGGEMPEVTSPEDSLPHTQNAPHVPLPPPTIVPSSPHNSKSPSRHSSRSHRSSRTNRTDRSGTIIEINPTVPIMPTAAPRSRILNRAKQHSSEIGVTSRSKNYDGFDENLDEVGDLSGGRGSHGGPGGGKYESFPMSRNVPSEDDSSLEPREHSRHSNTFNYLSPRTPQTALANRISEIYQLTDHSNFQTRGSRVSQQNQESQQGQTGQKSQRSQVLVHYHPQLGDEGYESTLVEKNAYSAGDGVEVASDNYDHHTGGDGGSKESRSSRAMKGERSSRNDRESRGRSEPPPVKAIFQPRGNGGTSRHSRTIDQVRSSGADSYDNIHHTGSYGSRGNSNTHHGYGMNGINSKDYGNYHGSYTDHVNFSDNRVYNTSSNCNDEENNATSRQIRRRVFRAALQRGFSMEERRRKLLDADEDVGGPPRIIANANNNLNFQNVENVKSFGSDANDDGRVDIDKNDDNAMNESRGVNGSKSFGSRSSGKCPVRSSRITIPKSARGSYDEFDMAVAPSTSMDSSHLSQLSPPPAPQLSKQPQNSEIAQIRATLSHESGPATSKAPECSQPIDPSHQSQIVPPSPPKQPPSYRLVVQSLIAANEPSKLSQIDRVMEKYQGREEELIKKLDLRYRKRRAKLNEQVNYDSGGGYNVRANNAINSDAKKENSSQLQNYLNNRSEEFDRPSRKEYSKQWWRQRNEKDRAAIMTMHSWDKKETSGDEEDGFVRYNQHGYNSTYNEFQKQLSTPTESATTQVTSNTFSNIPEDVPLDEISPNKNQYTQLHQLSEDSEPSEPPTPDRKNSNILNESYESHDTGLDTGVDTGMSTEMDVVNEDEEFAPKTVLDERSSLVDGNIRWNANGENNGSSAQSGQSNQPPHSQLDRQLDRIEQSPRNSLGETAEKERDKEQIMSPSYDDGVSIITMETRETFGRKGPQSGEYTFAEAMRRPPNSIILESAGSGSASVTDGRDKPPLMPPSMLSLNPNSDHQSRMSQLFPGYVANDTLEKEKVGNAAKLDNVEARILARYKILEKEAKNKAENRAGNGAGERVGSDENSQDLDTTILHENRQSSRNHDEKTNAKLPSRPMEGPKDEEEAFIGTHHEPQHEPLEIEHKTSLMDQTSTLNSTLNSTNHSNNISSVNELINPSNVAIMAQIQHLQSEITRLQQEKDSRDQTAQRAAHAVEQETLQRKAEAEKAAQEVELQRKAEKAKVAQEAQAAKEEESRHRAEQAELRLQQLEEEISQLVAEKESRFAAERAVALMKAQEALEKERVARREAEEARVRAERELERLGEERKRGLADGEDEGKIRKSFEVMEKSEAVVVKRDGDDEGEQVKIEKEMEMLAKERKARMEAEAARLKAEQELERLKAEVEINESRQHSQQEKNVHSFDAKDDSTLDPILSSPLRPENDIKINFSLESHSYDLEPGTGRAQSELGSNEDTVEKFRSVWSYDDDDSQHSIGRRDDAKSNNAAISDDLESSNNANDVVVQSESFSQPDSPKILPDASPSSQNGAFESRIQASEHSGEFVAPQDYEEENKNHIPSTTMPHEPSTPVPTSIPAPSQSEPQNHPMGPNREAIQTVTPEQEEEEEEAIIHHVAKQTFEGNPFKGQLSFTAGFTVLAHSNQRGPWWLGRSNGRTGWFPASAVVPASEYLGSNLGDSNGAHPVMEEDEKAFAKISNQDLDKVYDLIRSPSDPGESEDEGTTPDSELKGSNNPWIQNKEGEGKDETVMSRGVSPPPLPRLDPSEGVGLSERLYNNDGNGSGTAREVVEAHHRIASNDISEVTSRSFDQVPEKRSNDGKSSSATAQEGKELSDTTPDNHAKKKKPKQMWKAATDEATGLTYYYHVKTRRTTWEKPEGYEEPKVPEKDSSPSPQKTEAKVVKTDRVKTTPSQATAFSDVKHESKPSRHLQGGNKLKSLFRIMKKTKPETTPDPEKPIVQEPKPVEQTVEYKDQPVNYQADESIDGYSSEDTEYSDTSIFSAKHLRAQVGKLTGKIAGKTFIKSHQNYEVLDSTKDSTASAANNMGSEEKASHRADEEKRKAQSVDSSRPEVEGNVGNAAAATPQADGRNSRWKAALDKVSGRTYYYHKDTKETVWEKPKGF